MVALLRAKLIRYSLFCAALLAGLGMLTAPAQAAPAGFTPELIATGLNNPTAMQFAPDGRLFVAEQAGTLRVIDAAGNLLPTPFLTVTPAAGGERGLLGVAIDPNFATNRYVYIYYTNPAPLMNRVSRFTADPNNTNVALPGSEVVLLDLDALTADNHNGGAMHFGPDGRLYIATGDNSGGPTGTYSQEMDSFHGKMLRINTDGSIPTDNPFYTTATGDYRAIWALGFRNPFTFSFQPGTGRMFINDVGEGAWEEINEGAAGANYGWPHFEGDDPGLVAAPGGFTYTSPVTTYPNNPPATCAITGGAFYTTSTYQYPVSYLGDYFYGDFCGGFIRSYDIATDTSTTFDDTLGFGLVDLKVSTSGELYYLTRDTFGAGGGKVYRFVYNGAPEIIQNPQSATVDAGGAATFTCSATGGSTLQYQWQVNGVDIPGATGTSYTVPAATAAENGGNYTCVVTNPGFGSVSSAAAVLTVNVPTTTVAQAQPEPQIGVFDPAISKLGFLIPGQVGVTGEQLEWVITVNNTGDATGTNVVITDTLRDELRIDRVDTPNGTVSINGQTMTLRLASLAPGESLQFSIFTTVLDGTQIDNTVCINADNLAAQECVSAVAIRSLPATGETPWWRVWAVVGAFASVGLAILSIGMLMMLDMAMQAPELEEAVIPVMDVEHGQG